MKTTINLLPPGKKQSMQSAFVFAYVQSLLMIVFILTCIVSGTLFSVRFMLVGTLNGLSKQTGPDTEEFTQVSQEIKDINDYIKQMDMLTSKRVAWSSVLNEITDLLPEDVTLSHISVTHEGRISMNGTALHRQDVLTIDDRLHESPSFTDITSPLSNILQRDDVKFEFDVQYAPLAPAPEDKEL